MTLRSQGLTCAGGQLTWSCLSFLSPQCKPAQMPACRGCPCQRGLHGNPRLPQATKKVRHSVASLPGHPNVSDEQAHSLPFPPRQKLIIPIVWYFFRRFSLTCCKLAWVCGSPFKSKCTPATDSTLVNNPQPSFQHSLQSVNAIIEPTFNIKGSNNLTHQINT